MAQHRDTEGVSQTRGVPASTAPTHLETVFAHAQPKLTPRRRLLIRAILDNLDDNYHLSSIELAKRHGTDASNLVRTLKVLGYTKFADFAADMRRHFVARITPLMVAQAANRQKQSVHDRIHQVIEKDAQSLRLLLSNLDTVKVLQLAKLIHRARRIVVVGVDLASPLSNFLSYCLTAMGFDAEAPTGSAGNLYHKIRGLNSKDLFVAISFGRCLRDTVEGLQFAKQRGVPTFGITDSDATPIAKYSGAYLIAPVLGNTFAGSYSAVMSVLNCIVVACAHVNPKRTLDVIREWEREYVTAPRYYQEPRIATVPRKG